MTPEADHFTLGFRGTWWPLSIEWYLEDSNGRKLKLNEIEAFMLDGLTPEQRSQWFFLSTVWPRIKHGVLFVVVSALILVYADVACCTSGAMIQCYQTGQKEDSVRDSILWSFAHWCATYPHLTQRTRMQYTEDMRE